MQMIKRDFGIGGFENGVGGVRRRNKDNRSVGARGLHSVSHGVENRALQMLRAAFAGRYTTDYLRAVLDHLLRVEGSFAAGEALHD